MLKYAYLVYVDQLSNHNKFYEAKLNDDGSIDVCYGRVGSSSNNHHYAPYEKNFHELISSKERKGYEDVTALHVVQGAGQNEKAKEELNYQEIDDSDIQELVELLVNSSREFMKSNYTITIQEVTPKMIDEAQRDLSMLIAIANSSEADTRSALYDFNDTLSS